MAYTVTETLGLRHHLAELGTIFWSSIWVLCDNVSATYITVNLVLHGRSKHRKVDCQLVRKHVSQGDLVINYILAQLQVADMSPRPCMFSVFHF